MFTLKLYRRACPTTSAIMTKTIAVHRVVTSEIGDAVDGKFKALELWAFKSDQSNDYEKYYVGEPQRGMTAYGKEDLHMDMGEDTWWGWGLLENWEGNTSEHYRPASYG